MPEDRSLPQRTARSLFFLRTFWSFANRPPSCVAFCWDGLCVFPVQARQRTAGRVEPVSRDAADDGRPSPFSILALLAAFLDRVRSREMIHRGVRREGLRVNVVAGYC